MGLRLLENPQRKNKLVTRMKANCVFVDPELVVFMFFIINKKSLRRSLMVRSRFYIRGEITTELVHKK